jgi:hypothetical protein
VGSKRYWFLSTHGTLQIAQLFFPVRSSGITSYFFRLCNSQTASSRLSGILRSKILSSYVSFSFSFFAPKQSQAIDFLIAHRETFVLLLKDPRAEVTLSVIREQQLLVSFCAHVHPFVDRAQLVGFVYIPWEALLTKRSGPC